MVSFGPLNAETLSFWTWPSASPCAEPDPTFEAFGHLPSLDWTTDVLHVLKYFVLKTMLRSK